MDVFSHIIASSYGSVGPLAAAGAWTCSVNGQAVECPAWIGPAAALFWILYAVIFILMIVSIWKVFKKAGKPGWAAIIPIYNVVVMLEIARKPVWWVILFFIPFVSLVVAIMMLYGVSTSFGKGVGFTIGLIFLPFIFYPILAFGKSQYGIAPISPTAPMSTI